MAPVGLAWQRSIQDRPDLKMLDYDGLQTSVPGTNLAVLVLYATIFEQSLVGLSYQPMDILGDIDTSDLMWKRWLMTDDKVEYLQRIAWETVQDYQSKFPPETGSDGYSLGLSRVARSSTTLT